MSSLHLIIDLSVLTGEIETYCQSKQLTKTIQTIDQKKTKIEFRCIHQGLYMLDIYQQDVGFKLNVQGKDQKIINDLIDELKNNKQYNPDTIQEKKFFCIPTDKLKEIISNPNLETTTSIHTQYHRKHKIQNAYKHYITVDEYSTKNSEYLKLVINGHQKPYEQFEYNLLSALNILPSDLPKIYPDIFEELEKRSISCSSSVAQKYQEQLDGIELKMKEHLILGLRFTESSLHIPEYSFILFLFFRPLESLLKEIIEENINNLPRKWDFGNIFISNKAKFELNKAYTQMFNQEEIQTIENSYSFFNNYRHQSAHSPSLFSGSYFCDTITKAKEIADIALMHIKKLNSLK